VYECKVEETAPKHAQKCVFKQSGERGVGENIWVIGARGENLKQMATSASQSWFSELKKAGVPSENRLTTELWNRPRKAIGYYTQVGMLPICFRGNMIRSMIYTVGEPCQTDCDCQCGGCRCGRNEELCVKPALIATIVATTCYLDK
ncbi:unnamed protein product, partial [Angiostrongylus costaricensis]|uniref:SCP domain-containing protein n=1 Tax=Angiostrongylus costaricensis TaxID=334426 RepID=A0A0R3PAE0_ANGCS